MIFMSYINFDLLITRRNCELSASHNISSWINDLKAAGEQCFERGDQLNPDQEHMATHIFSNLVTHVIFFQFQCYIS